MPKVVGATDHHDSRVVPELLQHGLTEPEKRRIRYAVIIENNAFINFGERPVNTGSVALSGPQVRFRVVMLHIAGPVDVFNDSSCPCAAFSIGGRARPVSKYEQLFWLSPRDGLKDLAGGLGTVEDAEDVDPQVLFCQ